MATDVTHVKLTPTKAHTGASIKVGKTGSLSTVTSGSASGAIALGAAGTSTPIKVEVTAESGTKQTYTVTVARAGTATGPLTIGFGAATYTFTEGQSTADTTIAIVHESGGPIAADGTIASTKVKWSIVPGANNPVRALFVTVLNSVPSCDAGVDYAIGNNEFVTSLPYAHSLPICNDSVGEDSETFTLRIEPGTGYVVGSQSETVVTIQDNDPPGAPGNLRVTPSNTRLDLSWTKPAGTVTGYDVQYKLSTASSWSSVTRSGTALSQAIGSLTNGTVYDVRVRATNSHGNGAWVAGTGTPVAVLPPGRVVAMRVIADRITSWRGESGQLRVYWQGTRGGGAHDGYEVQYTASGTVPNDAAAGADRDAGWVDAGGGKGCCWKSWSQHISGLPADKQYRVRVRAVHSGRDTAGPWSYDRRSLGAMKLRADFNPRYFGVAEGSSVKLTVELTHAAPAGGMKVQIAVTGVTGGTATLGADYRLNKAPAPADRTGVNFDIPAGQKTGTATLYILDDEEPEGNETIDLRAHQRVRSVVPSSNLLTLVIGANDGHSSDTAMKILTMNADGNSPDGLFILDPPFDPSTANYRADVPNRVENVRFSGSTSSPQARLTVNGGPADAPVALKEGANLVDVKVTSADTQHQRTYTVTVNRAAAEERPEPPKTPLTAAIEGVPGEHDDTELELLGSVSDRAARNRLSGRWLAGRCAAWIEKTVEVRRAKSAVPQGAIVLRNGDGRAAQALLGSFSFSTDGLGIAPGNPLNLIQASETAEESERLGAWFDTQWSGFSDAADAKSDLVKVLRRLAAHGAPSSIYALILHHLLRSEDGALDEERIVRSATGIRDTEVWKRLFKFQRDGVVGAVDKLERFGGCIVADSVGLGKTFEALAIIKYHELRNDRVLVLCPKRLRDNWSLYRANDRRNILARDRFNYDILNHTDLSRDGGLSGDIDLAHVNWGNYDLVVIDESHNFRNKRSPRQGGETRYDRLMRRIVPRGRFHRVVGNPPFGDEVPEGDEDHLGSNTLSSFSVAETRDSVASEHVILERSIRFLEAGGRLGLVLPDGLLNNQGEISNCPHVRRYLAETGFIEAIVSLTDHAFRKSGAQNKTSILFFRKFTDTEARTFTSALEETRQTADDEAAAIAAAWSR